MRFLRDRRPCLAARAVSATMAATLLIASLPLAAATAQPASAPRFRGEPVTLNFVNADIEGVTRAMAAILKRQFIVDPRVARPSFGRRVSTPITH